MNANIGWATGNGVVLKHTGTPVPILVSGRIEMPAVRHGDLFEYRLAQSSQVQVLTFDLRGKRTLKLFDAIEEAGYHSLALDKLTFGFHVLDFRAGESHKTVKVIGN